MTSKMGREQELTIQVSVLLPLMAWLVMLILGAVAHEWAPGFRPPGFLLVFGVLVALRILERAVAWTWQAWRAARARPPLYRP